jgi:hypothetical protein
VTLYRCLPWDGSLSRAIGVLSFPRELQGGGRHDAPERYGCLYASEEPLSAVVEELARFAGTELAAADLRRSRMPLALATLQLAGAALLVDLDDPGVLAAEGLRPSLLATADRTRTQAMAAALYERHAEVAGLRWWSTFDPRWKNITLFDRSRDALSVAEVEPLGLGSELVGEAASFLGLRIAA